MSLLSRVLFRDWPLKLTAVGLAAVLYMGVAIGESTRSWTGPVPIEVLNAPSGGALLDDPGVVQRIRYQAPDDIAVALTNESFRASIDLSSVEPRAGAVTVEVPVDVFPVDPRVRVISYEPTGRTLRVDEVVSVSMPVTIDSGPLPQGIELGPVMVEPNQVVISGASSRVSNVRSVEGRFVVDASGINIDEDVDVEVFDDVGAIVPGVGIEPATVRVRADVARQLAYTTLPVIPELTGEPQHGRRVDNVSVQPATVTVSGENPAVRQLDAIPTEPLDISGQGVELVAEVPLALPEEVTGAGVDTVSVIVTFTEALGSRAFETGTAITGAQADLTYQVAEPSVRVVISGPVEQLDQVGPEEIVVEIPVAGLALGDNAVMPTVRSPRGTNVVSITPETVRVTVAEAP